MINKMDTKIQYTIQVFSEDHYEKLYLFEQENKDFFESILPPRPEGYNAYSSFSKLMDALLEEQGQGLCHLHVVLDSEGHIIGRLNLHKDGNMPKGTMELGYRLSEGAQGKGIASRAVADLLKMAKEEYGLKTIEAGTATTNIGSRRVLEKNSFKIIDEVKAVMKVNDQWLDGVLYQKIL